MKASKATIRKALAVAIRATPPVGPSQKQNPQEWYTQQQIIIGRLRKMLDE